VANVATTAIDSLKSQPNLIVLVILNVLMFALLYFGIAQTNGRRDDHLMKVIEQCLGGKHA
jgi:hypothetical protein